MSGSRFNDLSAENLEKELDDLYKQRFRLAIQKQMTS
jgi:large subunit ribosomal protein L14